MKKIYITILSVCFVLLFATTSFATTVNDIEPNNSASEAQLIQRNNEDPAQIITGNYTSQQVVIGNLTDGTDQDWYKVYLPANSNTILGINSSALSYKGDFEIYDENLNLISRITHVQDSSYFGAIPYYANIQTTGFYYVKVSTISDGGDYRFYIGGPDYALNSYIYTAPSALTLTPTIKTIQATYDFRNVTSIPSNAIVYSVTLDGTKTNNATNQARSIKVASDSSWITTAAYTYVADVPVVSNKILKNSWVFKLDGTVSASTGHFDLIPKITFKYIYPVLPH